MREIVVAKLGKIEGNPLKSPKVMSKWYSIDEFSVTVEKCRACGKSVTITREDLSLGRFTFVSVKKALLKLRFGLFIRLRVTVKQFLIHRCIDGKENSIQFLYSILECS